MGKTFTGGCLCGAIRFEITGPLQKVHTCSCKMCQRHTGAITSVWAEVAKSDIRWTGPGGAPAAYRSSDISSRAFCPQCGSSIGAIDVKPVVALLVGCFDKSTSVQLKPLHHFNRSGRPKWWHVTTG